MDSISKACTTEYKDQKHFTKAFAHLKEVKKETPRPTVYYALNPEQSVNSKLPPTPDTEDQLNTWYKRIKKHQKGSKNLFLGNHIVADTTITKEQKARLDTLFSTQDDHAATVDAIKKLKDGLLLAADAVAPLVDDSKVKADYNLWLQHKGEELRVSQKTATAEAQQAEATMKVAEQDCETATKTLDAAKNTFQISSDKVADFRKLNGKTAALPEDIKNDFENTKEALNTATTAMSTAKSALKEATTTLKDKQAAVETFAKMRVQPDKTKTKKLTLLASKLEAAKAKEAAAKQEERAKKIKAAKAAKKTKFSFTESVEDGWVVVTISPPAPVKVPAPNFEEKMEDDWVVVSIVDVPTGTVATDAEQEQNEKHTEEEEVPEPPVKKARVEDAKIQIAEESTMESTAEHKSARPGYLTRSRRRELEQSTA